MPPPLQPFETFIRNAVALVQQEPDALGLAIGGSYASGAMDAYSDLDLILVTTQLIAPNLDLMRTYAARLGEMLASFRGDHVGEPRLLIALYDKPLLHVDIKFLVLDELQQRIEDPVVLWEREGALTAVMGQTPAQFPPFDFVAVEDRFWVWVHYAALKIGRGEYLEALDFLSFVRAVVLGPMLHLRNGGLPRGVRRLEASVEPAELAELHQTLAAPEPTALLDSLEAAMRLYERLRDALAPATLQPNRAARRAVQVYLTTIRQPVAPADQSYRS